MLTTSIKHGHPCPTPLITDLDPVCSSIATLIGSVLLTLQSFLFMAVIHLTYERISFCFVLSMKVPEIEIARHKRLHIDNDKLSQTRLHMGYLPSFHLDGKSEQELRNPCLFVIQSFTNCISLLILVSVLAIDPLFLDYSRLQKPPRWLDYVLFVFCSSRLSLLCPFFQPPLTKEQTNSLSIQISFPSLLCDLSLCGARVSKFASLLTWTVDL